MTHSRFELPRGRSSFAFATARTFCAPEVSSPPLNRLRPRPLGGVDYNVLLMLPFYMAEIPFIQLERPKLRWRTLNSRPPLSRKTASGAPLFKSSTRLRSLRGFSCPSGPLFFRGSLCYRSAFGSKKYAQHNFFPTETDVPKKLRSSHKLASVAAAHRLNKPSTNIEYALTITHKEKNKSP